MISRTIVGEALADFTGVEIHGTATMDAEHGRQSMNIFANMSDVDIVLAYGKTSQSFGNEMQPLSTRPIVLPAHGRATKLISLPPAASSWWSMHDNFVTAIDFVRRVVDGEVAGPGPAEFSCWPDMAWN